MFTRSSKILSRCPGVAGVSLLWILVGTGSVWGQDVSFIARRDFAAGNSPQSVAVGDFNGDGVQDLAVANFGSNNVSVLLGNGDGTFRAAVNYGAGSGPVSVAVGDFNGDRALDLAVANFGSNNVSVLLGNGDGTFRTAVNFGAGVAPRSVAMGDFNGDGVQDLAVANSGLLPDPGNVSVLLGMGASGRRGTSLLAVLLYPWRWATSMAMGRSIWWWLTTIPTTSRCCWGMAMGASGRRGTSLLAVFLYPSRWPTSMGMGCKTWRWSIRVRLHSFWMAVSWCSWGTAMGVSRRRGTSLLALVLNPWRRATSMGMGCKTWRWPTMVPTMSQCCWATAMEASRGHRTSVLALVLNPWRRATSMGMGCQTWPWSPVAAFRRCWGMGMGRSGRR